MKHTSGKWAANADGSIIWAGNHQILHALCTPETQAEAMHNGRLAAAAPDLLAVVEAVLEIGNRKEGGLSHGIDPLEFAATIAPMARAAIAKAQHLADNNINA